ncbi:50S ribosomal protein L20 [Candidatus Margulisiibacteriota bacterium]
MVRVKRGNVAKKRRKKLLTRAKGFRGSLHKLFRPSKQAVIRAMAYATRDRKAKKREFRSLWIIRINARAREFGITYSKLINGLKKSNIVINRKTLAYLAVADKDTFKKIVEQAKVK